MEYIFERYRVNGEDFLIFDAGSHEETLTAEKVRRICHHHFGVGVQAVVVSWNEAGMTPRILIYNSEGKTDPENKKAVCAYLRYLYDRRQEAAFNVEEYTSQFEWITSAIQKNSLSIKNMVSTNVRETGRIITSEYFIKTL